MTQISLGAGFFMVELFVTRTNFMWLMIVLNETYVNYGRRLDMSLIRCITVNKTNFGVNFKLLCPPNHSALKCEYMFVNEKGITLFVVKKHNILRDLMIVLFILSFKKLRDELMQAF